MRKKPLGIEPPEPVLFRPTASIGIKVYCPEMKAHIVFQDETKLDRWFKRYQTQDAMRINGIAAHSRKIYDQLRKYETL